MQHFRLLAVNCPPMSESSLSERDVCTKLITPAVERAGWDIQSQVQKKRIVAKVEHLINLCEALEAARRRSEDHAAKLAEAVVQEIAA
jgi:type I site-specific restriction endonuclease